MAKVREELAETNEALAAGKQEEVEEEIGDLLFSVVNLARKAGVQAEAAMAAANEKFIRRFHAMERRMEALGMSLEDASLEAMDQVWNEMKERG